MSTRQQETPSRVITSRDDLIDWIKAGEKPETQWRIGTEHEKFVFCRKTHEPVPYEGEYGINALMRGLMDCCGWEPILEENTIIALKRAFGEPGATVSLEPGGQFELSGAPLENVHQTAAELQEHLVQCERAGSRLGLAFLGLGFAPSWSLKQTPQMPKQRYKVMTAYMPKVGTLGLEMMYRTATIQVNLDFSSERDMVEKMRLSLALQPVATALFANSPFTDGRPNGFKSMRSQIWRHTDNNRTGMLPFVFESTMGYEAYVDYALNVPMYFVYRSGRYIDVAGASFKDFMSGSLEALPGERPTLDDWSDHLTTLFPEVRLKRFLEMRGADGGSRRMICALSAFWVGLLYDSVSRASAWDLVRNWTQEQRQDLRDDVPRLALEATINGQSLQALACEIVEISREGLKRRDRQNAAGWDETSFLDPLIEIAHTGRTSADRLLEMYHGPWAGQIAPIFDEAAL